MGVLAALVAGLTVLSAVAFGVVVWTSEAATTRQAQTRLNQAAMDLAKAVSTGPVTEAWRETTRAALREHKGVEGGFYDSPSAMLMGYAFPTAPAGPRPPEVPPRERPIIEDVARQAARSGQLSTSVLRAPRDTLLFAAVPLPPAARGPASAWVMMRVPQSASGTPRLVAIGVAAFAVASVLCVVLAYWLARGMSRDVAVIERRLRELALDPSAPAGDTSPGFHELAAVERQIDELARSLADRMARERQLRTELEHKERLAALGQVAAGVAHEIRNPLATVRLRAQLVERANHGPEVTRAMGIVLHEIARLDVMVDGLLSYSRSAVLRIAPINVSTLVARSLNRAGENHRRDDVRMTQTLEPELEAEADSVRLQQVVDNVVRNALDAIEGSGVIDVTTRRHNGGVEIAVADSGPGISDEALARVFEPFFTTKVTGIGLGLSVARSIVEAHGGRMTVARRDVGGTLVSIWLPTADGRTTMANKEEP
jgi:signal transduction histidine kinase